MKRYLLLTAAMMGVMLLLFGLVEALGVPLLTDPRASLRGLGALAAPLGVGLLVADVVLPVPSSLVMIAHGALVFSMGNSPARVLTAVVLWLVLGAVIAVTATWASILIPGWRNRSAELPATIRLFSSASMTKVLFAALPYQVRAKCWKSPSRITSRT